MKKSLYIIFAAFALLSVSCMEIDNFDAPEEHLTGNIVDVTTGKNILADQGEARVRIWERSFSLNPSPQDIPVKLDGSYNNTKLFIGTYDMVAEGPWWPVDTLRNVPLKNTVQKDFQVTPYLKITDFNVTIEDKNIVVEGRLAAPAIPEFNQARGDVMPQVMDVRCFFSLNQYCGNANHLDAYYNLEANKKKLTITNVRKSWKDLSAGVPDADGTTYSKDMFRFTVPAKEGYTLFVRMGARVNDSFQMYNYSEVVKIDIPQIL